jgi:uncharacterized YigZ family protein
LDFLRERQSSVVKKQMAIQSDYLVPAKLCRVYLTVKRSRFIATITRAASPKAAKTVVRQIRDEFHDASHNCWAFAAGPPGDSAAVGASDDGEPHGTAGRPMLNILLHSSAGEMVAVVTRYYGGIKLGTGGLARAYRDAVKMALENAVFEEKQNRIRMSIHVEYQHLQEIQRICRDLDARMIEQTYGEKVLLVVAVPEKLKKALEVAANRYGCLDNVF